MLNFRPEQPVAPFIADQKLYRLAADDQWKQLCLQPRHFAEVRKARREYAADARSDRALNQDMPPGCRWEPIADREAYLLNLRHRRLCLTIDAGIGKSTAMLQIQYLRGGCLDGHLVIASAFDNLPTDPLPYINRSWFFEQLKLELSDRASDAAIRQLLNRKLAQNQVTLLVDALDQITLFDQCELYASQRAESLGEFLARPESKHLRCVVSGRPPSIDAYWYKLFAPSGPWEFVQVDHFDREQRKIYLGDRRAELLERLDADLVAIPRILETLRRVNENDVDGLANVQTASDIYWMAIDDTLNRDMKGQTAALKREPAEFLFSLLAFESLRLEFFNGVQTEEAVNRIHDRLIRDRLEQIAEFRDRPSKYFDLNSDLIELAKLNSVIDYCVLETSDKPERIVFRDSTIRDFFAALWVVNYMDPSSAPSDAIRSLIQNDRDWLRKTPFRQQSKSPVDYEPFWRFAAEMPRSPARNDAAYVHAMSVLYEPDEQGQTKWRSTEMIYRSWPSMLTAAEFESTIQAQQEAWRMASWAAEEMSQFNAGQFEKRLNARLDSIPNAARQTVLRFLTQYPSVYRGARGPQQQAIARHYESGFVDVPVGSKDELYCFGENGERVEIEAPFRLSKFATTNQLFSLFETLAVSSDRDSYPVVGVTWYDAWVACLFLHGHLPSEDEWEYANRNRSGPVDEVWPWCFDDRHCSLSEFAHFAEACDGEGNLVIPSGPVQVGLKKPCAGLFDMHGNVWEWTDAWWNSSRATSRNAEYRGHSRVLRGGSFRSSAEQCKSGSRFYRDPEISTADVGFRIARKA